VDGARIEVLLNGRVDHLVLLDQALAVEPLWEVFRNDLAFLSALGMAVRYPGETANREDARESAIRCRRFRQAARSSLV
jgi:hypothetical protein